MDKEFKILLVEDEPSECAAISKYVDSLDDVRLTGVTNNIEKALEILGDTLPDAVILDLELQKGYGSGVLFMEKFNEMKITYHPYILITTHNASQITYDHVRELGADFIMAKYQEDYTAEGVVDFLLSMKSTIMYKRGKFGANFSSLSFEEKEFARKRLEKRINVEFDLVGISPKVIGRRYLVEAIMLAIEIGHKSNLCSLVAKNSKRSVSSVERAMANAVTTAWKRSSTKELRKHYTAQIRSHKGSPTLSEFIYYYAEKLKDC